MKKRNGKGIKEERREEKEEEMFLMA